MERYANRPAFITLKDHKDNFRNKLPCRLINPAKPEIGIVAKKYLENINAAVISHTNLNQWRSTITVIDWFKHIPNKSNARFIKFDICEFYPSISEKLLDSALAYAGSITEISREVVNVIKQARKSLLFNGDEIWIKKGENPLFDVTMGSFDGAEICELVGLYILDKLCTFIDKKQIGLYRDDGLCVIDHANGPKLDRLRKDIIKLFKYEDLNITIETNLSVTDFLDVTLDLNTGKFYPYRKPNNKPMYINSNSNHPPSIVKQLPIMVNKRISDLSFNEQEFNKAKPMYENALESSGFQFELKYNPMNQNNKRRNRSRKIIWFNPPFNANVNTNIGKEFLKIVLNDVNDEQQRPCNCRDKNNCPLDGKCLSQCIVYKAEVETANTKSTYYGASEGEFKFRYNNHTKAFRLRKYENDTELSKHVWKLKDDNTPFTLTWSIESRAKPYRCRTRMCDLCTTEKVTIVRASPKGL